MEFREHYVRVLDQLRDDEKVFQKKLDELNSVDLVFLMDITGSMQRWVDITRKKIGEISTEITNMLEPMGARIAFVGYRDLLDEVRFEKNDFTDELWMFTDFLDKLKATGGDDEPEDVFGGLKQITSLNWKSKTRVVIHLFDAPPHGKQYNDCSRDNYPDGDPDNNDLDSLFQNFKNLGLDYYLVPLQSDQLSKMCTVFKSHYSVIRGKELTVFPVTVATESFCKIMVRSVEISLTGESVQYIDVPLSDDQQFTETNSRTFDAGLYSTSSSTVRPEKIKIQIMMKPFGSGSMRHAYFCKIISPTTDKLMVAKKWKSQHAGAKSRCFEQVKCHIRMDYYLKLMNTELGLLNSNQLICVPCKTLSIQSTGEWYSLEDHVPGTYVKHNNNYTFINSELEAINPIFQTIPHFSFQRSEGAEMVVDIQGVGNILTDPVVHSRQRKMFGMGDLGEVGMNAFLRKHRCNDHCRILKLFDKNKL